MQKLTLFLWDSNFSTVYMYDNCKSFFLIIPCGEEIKVLPIVQSLNILILMHNKISFKLKNEYFSTLILSLSRTFISIRAFYLEDIRVSIKEILFSFLVIIPFQKSVVC